MKSRNKKIIIALVLLMNSCNCNKNNPKIQDGDDDDDSFYEGLSDVETPTKILAESDISVESNWRREALDEASNNARKTGDGTPVGPKAIQTRSDSGTEDDSSHERSYYGGGMGKGKGGGHGGSENQEGGRPPPKSQPDGKIDPQSEDTPTTTAYPDTTGNSTDGSYEEEESISGKRSTLKPLSEVRPCNECTDVYLPVCANVSNVLLSYQNECFFHCMKYKPDLAKILRRGNCIYYRRNFRVEY